MPATASFMNTASSVRIILFFTLIFSDELVADESCSEQLSPCSCKTESGKYIILNALSTGENPAFSQEYTDKYTYQWDPCRQFDCWGTQVTACQTNFEKFVYPIGLQSSAKFGTDENGLFLQYDDGSATRYCKVYLKCNPSATTPKYTVQGEVSSLHYQMTLEAKEVCPVDHGGGVGGDVGLSIGDILMIIFFLALILYLVIGVVINIFVRKQSGTSAIPNKGFWTTLPGLIKDGGKFAVTKSKQLVNKDSYQPMA